jgi:hypothetical protein
MADNDALYTALRNADAAGDTAAATKLATYIKSLPAGAAAPASAPTSPERSAAPAAAPQPGWTTLPGRVLAGAGEAGLNMLTGVVAKPVSDVMGMSAEASDVLSGRNDGNAEGFKNSVRDALTYQPRTTAGQNIAQYNPLALIGKGVDAIGQGAQGAIAPDGSGTVRQMLGAGVHEAINQAPQFLGMKGPGAGVSVGDMLKGKARDTMQSALKPPLASLRTGAAGRAVDTMLDQGVNVTQGGINKLQGRVADLNTQIASAVQNSPAVIDKQAVGYRLQGVLDDFQNQVNPKADMHSVQKAWDEFLDHPLLNGTRDIPVRLAQQMKQATYKSLGNKSYGELKGADIEAQKALARGMKEDIAQAVPQVHPLNAEETKLLDTLPLVERRVLMDANKNPFGLGWLTLNPAKFAGFMADRSPLFKSIVARMLNQAASAAPAAGRAARAGGVLATQSANQAQAPELAAE